MQFYLQVFINTMPLIKGHGLKCKTESMIQNKEAVSEDKLGLSVHINIKKMYPILSYWEIDVICWC
jgi:hypothetical protein